MFAEDLSIFTATAGFGVAATLGGVARDVIVDAPGVEQLGGGIVTTEPSALVARSANPAVGQTCVLAAGDLPAYLAHLAGTYTVRAVLDEPPDGAFARLILARTA